ncbi:MAG TPA: hypothetical protein VK186_06020 [Candidatus Deferrimicrobium sp.]|nr:hypothetical protein [Candidatus Deferrimicrobium sp.]
MLRKDFSKLHKDIFMPQEVSPTPREDFPVLNPPGPGLSRSSGRERQHIKKILSATIHLF